MKNLKNFPYKRVLVLGLAKSGQAAAELLYDSGVDLVVNDRLPLKENAVAQQLSAKGINVVTGEHPLSILDEIDLVVKNPGIPYDNVIIEEATKRDLPIITEVELSFYLIDGPIIGITGSNGKTTTTTLIYELLEAGGLNPLIAGNIGEVASQVARHQEENQPVVMELSSFQLKASENFRPSIAVLLNITEAHLDYHRTMEDYVSSKLKLVKNMQSDDLIIFNQEEPLFTDHLKNQDSRKLPFSVNHFLDVGVSVQGEDIYFNEEKIATRSEITLPGKHNLENILAAVAVAKQFNIPAEIIREVLKKFAGVKHRLQFVTTKNGRLFYNDSKATNVLASMNAINSFNNPLVVIAGGLDRGTNFKEWFTSFGNVKHCIVYGESAPRMLEAAQQSNFNSITKVNDLEQATIEAYKRSEEGDVILLSPACASWDQFSSFEERGDMFIDAVHKL
ncbi:UDP-N-acetylmuramoyl-L-alanine--D-glutamate ligase [Halalkalibacillus sediminis]|uniref:UDP-N-acetylmuramoylalanine--D-glutamate ligase n=1 Tax=Halalkalibacillus sediminis TaxID=2018042 RepID=A0A2I0QW39_9BACI|nr:UDP-N-acetylmuramoyl-L-alanine--D-glutamate ligase [Halalkalibacillus sediminis]PKR78538.1 UDP-N-acetylmuramoyl-L-alanine--D-glutamate ligase [Halalkalibacillus sediminis]